MRFAFSFMACHTNLQGATPYHMEPIMGQLAESLNILIGDMKRHDERLQADLDRMVETANELVKATNELHETVEELID